ncbi:hypothetical protein SKAU_G00347690 [Synaphobranchus kaupii]|uniref:Uncharacterized protein n=1 Tax=Synaphobranchus kaupii TaxID=118154 RepID=A0A9Q1EJT1_SYNKA|nr:hypothetical protein SKAU_G00347690 [Synaphobranchus kaupii]
MRPVYNLHMPLCGGNPPGEYAPRRKRQSGKGMACLEPVHFRWPTVCLTLKPKTAPALQQPYRFLQVTLVTVTRYGGGLRAEVVRPPDPLLIRGLSLCVPAGSEAHPPSGLRVPEGRAGVEPAHGSNLPGIRGS